MKKVLSGMMLVSLALMVFTSSAMAKTTTIEIHGGAVLFEATSSFFDVYFQTFNGFGTIQADGPEISDNFSFTSAGRAEGTYFIDANNLKKEIFFANMGNMQALTSTSGTVTLITFAGGGWLKQQINVGIGFEGLTGIYMYFDADYIFLSIQDDKPEPKPHIPEPRLRLVSTSTNGNDIAISVKNVGDADLFGEATIVAGLSYRAEYWVPESVTDFARKSLGNGSIAAGETFTFIFTLPDVTEESFMALIAQKNFWTSYNYPDPPEDCIGITLKIGREKVFAFLPLNYKASLGIGSLSFNEEGQVLWTVGNFGIFLLEGDLILTAFLVSEANLFEPNAWIEFSQFSLGNGALVPGETLTFTGLPEIPEQAFLDLEEQDGELGQVHVQIRLLLGDRVVFFSLPVTRPGI